ncbi:PREDICTED: coiled-coil domain-containing protein 169-like [Priapulus caudatus]|uniref:Coiled-coil domain-containing protein 169-like n=1 Tax=Priapulus caudatus TaxID=37621 RepID=A0ABM1E578_PRICU|nr:PREDICTED: coiled-coil domain-containing protein 169-like [Priapulus caudatus]
MATGVIGAAQVTQGSRKHGPAADYRHDDDDDEAAEDELNSLKRCYDAEMQKRDLVETALMDIRAKIADFEDKIENPEHQDSEWKVRYEIQVESNQQLERQAILLQDRLDKVARGENVQNGELAKLVKRLANDRDVMNRVARDYEWRLEQEANVKPSPPPANTSHWPGSGNFNRTANRTGIHKALRIEEGLLTEFEATPNDSHENPTPRSDRRKGCYKI